MKNVNPVLKQKAGNLVKKKKKRRNQNMMKFMKIQEFIIQDNKRQTF